MNAKANFGSINPPSQWRLVPDDSGRYPNIGSRNQQDIHGLTPELTDLDYYSVRTGEWADA
jgi:hypothetical protein